MTRLVILFARAPSQEARAKGFSSPEAEGLFAAFAAGWGEAARRAGASLVIATPAEDFPAWRRLAGNAASPRLIAQRGRHFGDRLEDAVRRAGIGGGAVLVGGDVAPSTVLLNRAFEARERGAEAVIAPAGDGGVSLLALSEPDLALLSGIAARRRDVCARLLAALAARGRRVCLLEPARDVDGRRELRRLARQGLTDPSMASLARRALDRAAPAEAPIQPALPHPAGGVGPRLRAPPRAA
jgi:methylmalonyl-CoA mutase cobalamin-binding subunit